MIELSIIITLLITKTSTKINKSTNPRMVKNNHTFHFNHYKTVKHYGPIKFKAPTYLQNVISGSLERDPRLYLVTKDHNLDQQTYSECTLGGITKKYLK